MAISKSSVRRLGRALTRSERTPTNPAATMSTLPKGGREDRVFCTTSAVTTAVKTGTSISNYKLQSTSYTARPCIWDTVNKWWTPDQSATDYTCRNFVVLSASIAAGKFFKFTVLNGEWVADLSAEC